MLNLLRNMKRKFKFIDITTADVAFEAYGKTLEELFENAALAMFEVMVNTKKVKPKEKREIIVQGEDLKALLFEWLNELLFYYGAEGLVFSKFKVEIHQPQMLLTGICEGEPVSQKKHEVKTEVKAATYHKMKIEKTKAIL